MTDYKSLQACRMAPKGAKNTTVNGQRINCETVFNRAAGVTACQTGPDGNEQICERALQKRGFSNTVNSSSPFTNTHSR
ncbi:hypothetical protein EhV194 [Emiliania huxleyi virus 86]|uniref:Uncharacterized protein n=1 Tax=Emiliania huxleyi virus 86 (isolate United Kingdom/English Channel/1999) TaxID=654925 RepID=Q4A2T9_EHV8U|nr:hypothetical protein EhV194 [Emiliania huxleyi virus 86]AEO97588.1 hypothetical protein ENVG_00447 [Emiliania huxleyi virus 84]AEO98073.1 hypothetical protein ELVG_00398 [Emiliania huxleyi virus 203]AEP15726.1 hypothetical protein EQVG_00316 [Emiliania huxleyi virus 207]AEP16269.1 hypothetical protein ERVG_00396 [Emiliania huxleyi virus 208]AET98252.1 hypothetical protein EPVG_00365 [Emiliania huxleyi virus 201]AHA54791.1 hypothetical protein EhV145_00240 [Emiliania huxleyi virus 145]AHA5